LKRFIDVDAALVLRTFVASPASGRGAWFFPVVEPFDPQF